MKLGLVIDLDTCVGCHACAVACKEWNGQSLMAGGAPDYDTQGAEPSGVWFNRIRHFEVSPVEKDQLGGSPLGNARAASANTSLKPIDIQLAAVREIKAGGCTSKTVNVPMSCMHCEEADCVTVCPTGASYKRAEDGIVLIDPDKCMGCNYCSWACPYGARELDQNEGVMRKCTLCVDRIYDQALPEAERQPACVLACPTHARHFGDFDDPHSKVSIMSLAREGEGMLPELGYKPVNRYLPPRASPVIDTSTLQTASKESLKERLSSSLSNTKIGQMINRMVSL
jgi:sulfite dehydrogenase (quinone) subunit SoeB